MALIDLKKIRPHWKGEFAANIAYLVNDVVIYSLPFTNQRNIYICTTNSIGNLPSDVNFFDIMVQNIIPLDQMGEVYYYSTSSSPPQNTAITPPDGVATIEMTGSINSTTHDSRDYFLTSEGEGENPAWDIPKLNSRHTVRKLCKQKYGDLGTPTYAIMDNGDIWSIGGNNYHHGAGQSISLGHESLVKVATSPNFPGALDVIYSNSFAFCIDKERKLWHWGLSDAYSSARETTNNSWVFNMVRVGTGQTSSDYKTKYIHKFETGGAQGDDGTHHYTTINAALMTDGSLYTWGCNTTGAVANGTTATYQNTPWQISGTWTNVWAFGLERQTRVYATRLESGVEKLYAWGANRNGVLGVGDTTNRQTPTLVSGDGLLDGEEVGMIWGGDWGQSPTYNTVFMQTKESRKTYVCGDDMHGARGLGTNLGNNTLSSPLEVSWAGNTSSTPYLVDWQGGNSHHTGYIALLSDGSLRTWGYCQNGSGGNNVGSTITTPFNPILASPHLYDSPIVKVDHMSGYYSSWTGHEHMNSSFALRADGTMWSCGQNQAGQLGRGHNVYADSSYAWHGVVSYNGGDPVEHQRAEHAPSQRYWSIERDGNQTAYNLSYTMDQEQIDFGGSFKPIYQGLHRYVDFTTRHIQTDYTNDEPSYHTVILLDENGHLNVVGDVSYDGNGRELQPNGGLENPFSPVPLNFP